MKGTTLGVVTDIDGNFSITIPSDPNTVLVISFVGMKTQEIKVGTAPTLNVILKEASQTLEQVVVNGVFERKANTFTGSVKTISNDELKRVGNSNVLQSLKNLDIYRQHGPGIGPECGTGNGIERKILDQHGRDRFKGDLWERPECPPLCIGWI